MADPRWKGFTPSNWAKRYDQSQVSPAAAHCQSVALSAQSVKRSRPERFGWTPLGGSMYSKSWVDGDARLSYNFNDRAWNAAVKLITAQNGTEPHSLLEIALGARRIIFSKSTDKLKAPVIGMERHKMFGIHRDYVKAGWKVYGGDRYDCGGIQAYWDWTALENAGGWHVFVELPDIFTANIQMPKLDEQIHQAAAFAALIIVR